MNTLKFVLFPFSVLYGVIIYLRNKLFDFGLIHQKKIGIASINIGNLSVGGTGKSPMVLYLARLLMVEHEICIVSRGYGRTTRGLQIVNNESSYRNFGDEPSMYVNRFGKKTRVLVAENRKEAIDWVEKENKESCVLLDDAFQHRFVQAGLSILMTNYDLLFNEDYLLPVGRLREQRAGAHRSDIIVITKCPQEIPIKKLKKIQELNKYNKPIFLSRYIYLDPVSFGSKITISERILLVTGIANPKYLIEQFKEFKEIEILTFRDHHDYTQNEIQKIHQKIDNFAGDWSIVTTEKDFVRLKENTDEWNLSKYPWFYIPIEMEIENSESFNKIILEYVRKN